jgi:soluble lytic murein transglycosylase-like protein
MEDLLSMLSVVKKIMFCILVFVTCISMINFTDNDTDFEQAPKLSVVQETLLQFRNIIGIYDQKHNSIEKITAIINRYNPRMKNSKKAQIADEIYNMSIKYRNLDQDLICATITHESWLTWRPDIVSRAGAIGLMQLMPGTGFQLCKEEGIEWTNSREVLFDPVNNVRLGCRYLSRLIDKYNIDGGLVAYNGGPDQAVKWLASGRNDKVLFQETRAYVPAVLQLYDIYKN